MTTVLISGYYGFNNLGDEAVLGGILAGLRAELPEVEPVVLSADPAATIALHGVAAIPRMHLRAIRERLRGASLFISGGGSLLQDVTSVRSPFYYLWLLALAQRMGVPTMMLAQGVGPLNRLLVRRYARTVLNRLRAITVRDEASAALLETLGVTAPPIEVTADPSFLLEPESSEALESWWAAHIPVDRPVIGVALRQWATKDAPARYHAISDALADIARETGALLLFIPMQAEQDLHVAEQTAGWTPAESRVLTLPLTPREMLAAVGKCDFILAMRLHTLIFAVQREVPAYGLAYDPKVIDFSLAAGLPDPMPWEQITAGGLADALREQWAARDAQRPSLAPRAACLRDLARRNITAVREALGHESGQ